MYGVAPADVSKVTRLDTNVMGMTMSSYLLRPATNTSHVNSLAIIQQGHANELISCNVSQTANKLLESGYSVMVNGMPMYGWNVNFNIAQNKGSNETFTVPGGQTVHRPCNSHTGLLLDSNNQSLFSDGAGISLLSRPGGTRRQLFSERHAECRPC